MSFYSTSCALWNGPTNDDKSPEYFGLLFYPTCQCIYGLNSTLHALKDIDLKPCNDLYKKNGNQKIPRRTLIHYVL